MPLAVIRNSNNMKHLIVLTALIFFGINACSQRDNIDIDRINRYIVFLTDVELSAKEYILTLLSD